MKNKLHVGGVPEHFNAPWHWSLEQGLFQAEGLDLHFQEYPTGTGAMCQDLRSGKLDVAVVLTEGIVADILKEGGTRIIAAYVDSPLVWGIHTAQSSPVSAPTDLRGQCVAISRFGSGSHLMSLLFARDQGWKPGELQFAVAGDIDGLQQAVQGKAAAFLWEKFTTKPRVDAGYLRRIGEYPTPWPCFMIAAREQVIQEQPEALQRMLKALQTGCQRFSSQPDQAMAYIARRYHLQPQDVQAWWQGVRWSANGAVPLPALQAAMDALYSTGAVPTQTAPESLMQPLAS